MNQPLKISNISKAFGNSVILDKLSLTLNPEQIFGLIGLNGVGKTTLIKIILDLLQPDKGTVKLFGQPSCLPEARRNIVFLPERFYPSPFIKGKDFLKMSLSFHNKKYDQKEAENMAGKLGLNPDVLHKTINKFSKGMRQKLGIISVFLSGAKLLILDEPMSGLDPLARIQLKKLFLEESKKGKTIFFSSHILADIEQVCDHIAILHNHTIIFEGTVEQLKRKTKIKNLEESFLQLINHETV